MHFHVTPEFVSSTVSILGGLFAHNRSVVKRLDAIEKSQIDNKRDIEHNSGRIDMLYMILAPNAESKQKDG